MDFKDDVNWFDTKEYAVILYWWYWDKTLQEKDDRG